MQRLFLLLGSSLTVLVISNAFAEPLQIVTEEYPPYNYQGPDGITGVGTEVLQATLKELDMTVPITLYPWARAYKIARTENSVLIYTISRTREREQLFKWVGVIAPVDQCVFALQTRHDIVINEFDDLTHYEIGTVIDDVQEQYLREKGFPTANIQSNTSHEANFKKLMKGRIDLWTVLELTAYYIVQQHHHDPAATVRKVYCMADLSVEGDYMAFSKGTSDALVRQFQAALQQVKHKGAYDAIVQKYRMIK